MENVLLAARGRKIPRVPQAMLQMEFEEFNPMKYKKSSDYCSDYSPMVVSIGPYHHGKAELQCVQIFKQELVDLFVSGSGKSEDFFLQQFLKSVDIAKSYYMVESTVAYSKEGFAKMMLLDACFVISVNSKAAIAKTISSRLGKVVFSLALRDILLLENQIPFWLLKQLLILGYGIDYANWWIKNFICRVIYGNHRKEAGDIGDDNNNPPLFLLEALRRAIVSGIWTKSNQANHYRVAGDDDDIEAKRYDYSFHSVRDLKEKGIYFRPGQTGLVNDIKFKSFCFYGRVELPTFIVTNRSRVWLKNIIAYEMCPGSNVGLEVISYINFMKSIINDPKDVQELRDKRILINQLNSDDEVVKLFKEINTCGLDDDLFVFKVKEQIQKHYNSKGKTWMSELIIAHFLTPWKVLALVAAIFILFLTATQTYFTVFPRD